MPILSPQDVDAALVRECLRGSLSWEAKVHLRQTWVEAYLSAARDPACYGRLTEAQLCQIATRAMEEAMHEYQPCTPMDVP